MMKSKEKFTVIAEDNNSPFLHNWLFILGMSKYKLLNMDGPNMAIVSRQNKIQYLAQMDTWQKAHNVLKQRALQNHDYVEKLIDLADAHGQTMNVWTEKNIFNAPLHKYSNKKLIQLFKTYAELDAKEYVYGVALPILDFQGFSLVENTVTRFLKQAVPEEKYQHYFEVFTEPLHDSFSQEQEKSLLKIILPYFQNPKWKKTILSGNLTTIKNAYPKFLQSLKKHTEKYAWVYYVYKGPAYTESDFLHFLQDMVASKVNAKERLKNLELKRRKNNLLKQKYLRQLKPDPFSKAMLKLAAKMIWAKPRRKDYQSKSYYHVEKLQTEIARRLFLSLEQVRSTPILELEKMLKNKADPGLANNMYGYHICVRVGDGKVAILNGKKAQTYAKKYFRLPKESRNIRLHGKKELTGQIAFAGKARGKVKIVNKPEDMGKMNTGDILVSIATTPSIVPAMKRAAAIVTDEGGLTCHASIVSRELEIPCVVGLKIASRVLKDGDLVEVDANKGVVRKLT